MKLTKISVDVREINVPGISKNIFKPMFVTMTINGLTQGWANAIRRIFVDEIPIKVLVLDIDKFNCTDRFIKTEVVGYQLATLKINQKIPDGTVFFAKVPGSQIPTTDMLKIDESESDKYEIDEDLMQFEKIRKVESDLSKILKFNSEIELIEQVQFVDKPTYITAHVETWRKNIFGQGMASLVNQISRYAPDDDKIDEQEYTYRLDMHNNIEPNILLHLCFQTILHRLKKARINKNFVRIRADDNYIEYHITYEEETYTLGNLLYDAIYFIDPHIPMMTYTQRHTDLIMKFTVVSIDYLEDMIERGFEKVINAFEDLDAQVDKK